MRHAIELAYATKKEGNLPFGAVVVHRDQVIARGRSQERSAHDVTKHAELMAISTACATLRRTDLYDCVLYSSSEPCTMCASAALQAHIGHIVIGATRDDASHIFSPRRIRIFDLVADARHPVQLTVGVLKSEAVTLFDDIER